jgi:crotonobetainyl-CoA:carnitine CoA-transferase CaiB-like acyl-CoA transferase
MSAGDLLDGVRVVDLTDAYGAFSSRLLADLGAEVVRLEPRGGGRGRLRSPKAADGTSLHHLHRNVGKAIVESDDPAILDGLLAGADIAFCSRAEPSAPPLNDVEPARLAVRHPHLIVVSVTPFGLEGPTAGWRASELVAQSLSGVVYRSGVPELPPVAAPGSYCEDVGAAVAALASLLALRQTRQSGHGQLVDVSSILALAQCTEMSLPLWSGLGMKAQRTGAGLYPLFECTDGLARLVLPMSPGEWRSLISWLGSPPEWTGPEWQAAMLGPAEREQVIARLPARFAAGTRAELAAEGDACGVRITPVLTPAEVLSNEHVTARGSFAQIDIGRSGVRGAVPASMFGVDGRRAGAVTAPRTRETPPQWRPRPAPGASPPAPALPLIGIRVLEVGSGVAVPEAGRVLGEWGADVIKLESRRRPDFQRHVMGGDMNPAFSTPNRNKRVLAADLGTDAGRELVYRLLPQIDVLIENNATGVIDRLGLGWDTVSAINPHLVMVNSQLYGDRGPWASKKGYGPSARAIGGLTWLWAHGPQAPRGVMTIHPDHLAGRLVALGALSALDARDRTGRGRRVDVAQFEAVMMLLGDLLTAESLQSGAAQPVGNRSSQGTPWNLFRCADQGADRSSGADEPVERWLAVCVPDDAAWASLLSVAPEEIDRPEWRTHGDRLAAADAVDAAVAAWLRVSDAADTEELLQKVGVPAGQALTPRDHAEHIHFVGRGYPVPVEQPGSGPLLLEGPAFVAARMGVPRCEPAPLPGQHTAEVCRELLGLDDGAISGLAEAGAIDPVAAASR